MNAAEAAAALLQLVTDNRKRQCDALRAQAEADVRAILETAHTEARKRVRASLEEERKIAAARLARAQAQCRTRLRVVRQHALKALLEQGLERVDGNLRRHWRDPAQRWKWIEHAVLYATSMLPRGNWRLSHPRDWPAEEKDRLSAFLERRGAGITVSAFTAEDSIAAGIRIASGHAVFDATLTGFLSDRADLEAQLLFHLEKAGA